jgi:hypothetical protein
MRNWLLFVFVASCSLTGCRQFQQAVEDAKKETPRPPKDNYLVLLDLSDRILADNQQQVPKDIHVVQSIYATFKLKLNEKDPTRLYYTVSDKLKVLIAPQKNTLKEVYNMAGDLRIALASSQPEQKAKLIEETEKKFTSVLPELYRKAVISNNSTDYAGADIWRYFNEDLQDDLEKDAQNTLFIITDGYLNFESTQGRLVQNNRYTSVAQLITQLKKSADWNARFKEGDYGLLPVNKKFPNLKVVLLCINPKDDWAGEYSLLTSIWSKWFNEMGITSYSFIKDDNINEVDESLEKLMQVHLPASTKAVSWKPVTEIDSLLAATFVADDMALHAAPIPDSAFKKKDYSPVDSVRSSSHILSKSASKKQFSKQKEQVSFGPVF